MGGLFDTLAGLASPWGYVVVGTLALLEAAAFVGLVIPGESALLVGGFLAYRGNASLGLMIAVAAAGAIVGDSVGYEVGRHLGPVIKASRLGQRVGEERWGKAEAYLARRGGRAVFFGRFVGLLRALVPTVAGMSRMPYRTFLPWNAAGGLVWAPGFVLAGYAAGGSYHQVERWAGRASLVLLGMVVAVTGIVLAARAASHREAQVRAWAARQADRPWVRRLTRPFERQLAFVARRLRPGGAFGLSLTAGLVGLVLLAWLFGGLTQDVLAREGLVRLDDRVHAFLAGRQTPGFRRAAEVMVALGRVGVLAPVAVVASLLAWVGTRRLDRTLAPVLALGGAVILADLVGALVGRPGPGAAGLPTGPSFPSGPATQAAATYLAAAAVLGRSRPWRAQVGAVAGAAVIILLVGLAGLYLGQGWMTDVMAGWLLGAAWLAVVLTTARALRDLRTPCPADP